MRLLMLALLLLGIGGPAEANRPRGYPRSYDALIADARRERGLTVYGNVDGAQMAPIIAAFQRRYPGVTLSYHDLGASEIYGRFLRETTAERPSADLLFSSAMDLQVKLINDGFAQAYASPEKPALPSEAVWKNMGYGVTAEPVGIAFNRRLIVRPPGTHAALEAGLRRDRHRLIGRVAMYDPARSNVGYMHLLEDWSITRDTRSLLAAIADTRPRLFDNTEAMLDAVAAGRTAIAYNVVGSYALRRARQDPQVGVVFPRDYTIVTSRVAFIARDAPHPAAARLFLDFMLSRVGQHLFAELDIRPIRLDVPAAGGRLHPDQSRPMRVGPQLLVNLDRLRRARFLADWRAILADARPLPAR